MTTAETSAKLDSTLERIKSGNGSSGAPVVNVIEDASKAGQSRSRQVDGRWVIDQFVSDVRGNGRAAKKFREC